MVSLGPQTSDTLDRVKRDYSHIVGSLTGLSERSLQAHIALYGGYCDQLQAIEAAQPLVAGLGDVAGAPSGFTTNQIAAAPVSSLVLSPMGPLANALNLVRGEFSAKGISPAAWPNWVLGDESFYTQLGTTAVNIPWFLANPTLWALANQVYANRYTLTEVTKTLRHELGHAVFFAYGLGALKSWREVFGDPQVPYREDYLTDPDSLGHVSYTTGLTDHYGQKHPEEDWAECFARWLDSEGGWQAQYAPWPEALAKLAYVDALGALLKATHPNALPGRLKPYTKLPGTVAERLGVPRLVHPFSGHGWSEHAELLRRKPYYLNAVQLHELYFDGLADGGQGMSGPVAEALAASFGSVDAYLLDLRAAIGASTGWALTVQDPRTGRIQNVVVEQHHVGVPVNCPVLVAIDCWEHAYAMDYGTRKDLYAGAVFKNLSWEKVGFRLFGMAPLPGPTTLPVLEVPEEVPAIDAEPTLQETTEADSDAYARQANGPVKIKPGSEGKVAVQREVHTEHGTHKQVYWVNAHEVKPGDKKIATLDGKLLDKGQPILAANTANIMKNMIKKALLAGMEAPPHLLAKLGVSHESELGLKGVHHGEGGAPTPALKPPKKEAIMKQAHDLAKAKEEAAKEPPVTHEVKVPTLVNKVTPGQIKVTTELVGIAAAQYDKHNHNSVTGEAEFAANLVLGGVPTEYHDWWIKDYQKNSQTMSPKLAADMGWNALKKKVPGLHESPVGFKGLTQLPKPKTGDKQSSPLSIPGLPPVPKSLGEGAKTYTQIAKKGAYAILATFGAGDYGASKMKDAIIAFRGSQVDKESCEMRFGACSLLAKWQGRDLAHVAKLERQGIDLSNSYASGKPNSSVLDNLQAQAKHGHEMESGIKAAARASQAAHADGPEWITVYRGVKDTAANQAFAENAAGHGKVPSNGMTSFSESAAVARNVGGPIVFQTRIHRSQIAISHKAFPQVLGGEQEIVAFTNNHFIAEKINNKATGKQAHDHSDWKDTNVFEAKKPEGPAV